MKLAAKVAGIHWLYKHPSHAAELTAGYKNDDMGAYLPARFILLILECAKELTLEQIAKLFRKYNVSFDFTALEMRDDAQPSDCFCAPLELVGQTQTAAKTYGVRTSRFPNFLPFVFSSAALFSFYFASSYDFTFVYHCTGLF